MDIQTENQEGSVEIFDMADEEFNDQFDREYAIEPEKEEFIDPGKEDNLNAESEDTPGSKAEDETEKSDESADLDSLYKQQMSSEDAKLDKPILVKVKGKVLEIDSVNDLKDLAERGLGATQSFQQIAQHRKTLRFMEDNGLSMEDLNYLVQSKGQTPIESNPIVDEVGTIANEILHSDYADDFKEGLNIIPENVRNVMSQDPALLKDLAGDYASGIAQKIMPEAERLMMVKGMDFFSAYAAAGQAVLGSEPMQGQHNGMRQNNANKETLKAMPRGNTLSNRTNAKQDIWSMDDKSFDKYMNQL